MREPKAIDIFLLLLLSVIWGSAFFNIKIATYTYDTFTLVFVRVFFAALALVLWCFYKKIIGLKLNGSWSSNRSNKLIKLSFMNFVEFIFLQLKALGSLVILSMKLSKTVGTKV